MDEITITLPFPWDTDETAEFTFSVDSDPELLHDEPSVGVRGGWVYILSSFTLVKAHRDGHVNPVPEKDLRPLQEVLVKDQAAWRRLQAELDEICERDNG